MRSRHVIRLLTLFVVPLLAACDDGAGASDTAIDAGTDTMADVADAATDSGGDVDDAGTDSGTDVDDADVASEDDTQPVSDTGNPDAATPPSRTPTGRIHAEGTHLVDASGQVVAFRGVNLGGWLFHETWITGMDLSDYQRAWLAAHAESVEPGFTQAVDDAIRSAGKGTGAAWQEAFRAALLPAAGDEATAAFVDSLPGYASISDDSDLPFRLLLEERFGTAGRDELLDLFQAAWITEADIVWLAEHGFNLVRVPIGYRTLVTNSDAIDPTTLVWNEPAFARLQALLDWCEAHDVYAVVDIQESPGGHNDYSGPARLYESEAFQQLTVGLWEELSRRLADRDAVMAYSLLAEPMSAPSHAARDGMYDRLHDAIRAQGDDHLLVIHDGFEGLYTLPDPAAMGWTGVMYSTHQFEWSFDSADDYRAYWRLFGTTLVRAQQAQQVPYFIGSFSTMTDAAWAYESAGLLASTYESSGWSWSLWTYKRIDDPIDVALFGESTSWGVRGRLASPLPRPDVYQDDLDTLRSRMRAYADVVLNPNEALLQALTGRP